MSAPTSPSTTSPSPAPRVDPARLRVWAGAAAVVLLVLIWQSVDFVYLSTHEPPHRYAPLEAGAVAHGGTADFRLLSIQQTPSWGQVIATDDPASPDAGAVWVVAQLEVTPRVHEDYLLCDVSLVSTSGRVWDAADTTGSVAEGEDCAPDPEAVELGTTYRFRQGFEVPADEAGDIAGVALSTFSWKPYPVMRPPA